MKRVQVREAPWGAVFRRLRRSRHALVVLGSPACYGVAGGALALLLALVFGASRRRVAKV